MKVSAILATLTFAAVSMAAIIPESRAVVVEIDEDVAEFQDASMDLQVGLMEIQQGRCVSGFCKITDGRFRHNYHCNHGSCDHHSGWGCNHNTANGNTVCPGAR